MIYKTANSFITNTTLPKEMDEYENFDSTKYLTERLWNAALNYHHASAIEYIRRGALVIEKEKNYLGGILYERSILVCLLNQIMEARIQVDSLRVRIRDDGVNEIHLITDYHFRSTFEDDYIRTFEGILDCPEADHRLGDKKLYNHFLPNSYEAFKSRQLTRKIAESAVWKVGFDEIRFCFTKYLDFMKIVAHTCYIKTTNCHMWFDMTYGNFDKSINQYREIMIAFDIHGVTFCRSYFLVDSLSKCCVENLFLIDLAIGL